MSERNELLTVHTNKPVADLCSAMTFTETDTQRSLNQILYLETKYYRSQ